MTDTVFMTGATGFLGTQTARRLLASKGLRLVVLVRGKDHEEAVQRLSRTWWPWPELATGIGRRIEVLAGDVRLPFLGLEKKDYEGLAGRLTHIVHCAADLRLDGPIDELRAINVHGAAEMLDLAARAHKHHGLARFAHVSTAYVAGRRTGAVPEEDLSNASGFSNTYEQTKFEGERL
ncbi:MAG TPA: SDR family oxidoreductase, partial [bacterium]|nr:SDR family oxidoreductase [bacterium]